MSELPPELRRLFADEAETRLARLSSELLRLEEEGASDPELVSSVFRDAHTLKGSAGMMGFTQFAEVAHRMEDLLERVRSGEVRPTTAMVDALLRAVDGLRAQVPALAEGTPDNEALAALAAQFDEPAPDASPEEAPPPTERAPAPQPDPAPAPRAAARDFVRVPVERLDELARLTSEAVSANVRLISALAERLGVGMSLPPESEELSALLRDIQRGTAQARMLPVGGVVEPLRRAVREVAREQGKEVRFEVEGGDTELDRSVLDRLSDPLLHLVRNAVDHGVEPPDQRAAEGKPRLATVRMTARPSGGSVVIAISDDGRGIDVGRVREVSGRDDGHEFAALFEPGFSTAREVTSVSGRGVGLDVVRAALAPLRGRVDVRSAPGRGATFTMTVPLTVAAVSCLVVDAGGRLLAMPLDCVARTAAPEPHHTPLSAVLGQAPPAVPRGSVVVVDDDRERAFSVAAIVGRRDYVVQGLSGASRASPMIAGAAVDAAGAVVLVLHPSALLDAADAVIEPVAALDEPPQPIRVLVVDDASIVREVQTRHLTEAGYEVRSAFDGVDALEQLQSWPADLILVDIEMPRMNGIELTRALRADPQLRGTAVLVLTSLGSEEDRRRGMEAGADGYLVKGTFAAEQLLEAVANLLGVEQ